MKRPKLPIRNAKAAFEYAQNQLEQTKLRAPFDGFIQKKYVENYQKVQAGQGIVCLINPNKLQIQYTMPETNITYFSTPYQIYVEFDNYKGIRFKAKVKEYVEASPDGSGVPVFLYIDDPEFNLNKYKVLSASPVAWCCISRVQALTREQCWRLFPLL